MVPEITCATTLAQRSAGLVSLVRRNIRGMINTQTACMKVSGSPQRLPTRMTPNAAQGGLLESESLGI
jgi:hypothetical protein